MINTFKRVISYITAAKSQKTPVLSDDDKRLAAAALMFHVIAADGVVQPEESARMHKVLGSHYGVSGKEIDELIDRARDADSEAIDLFAFTRVLKRQLSHDERILLVEDLWEMVFADGDVHELEDNIVWRVAELIAVSSQSRIAMKRRVRARISAQHQDNPGEA